MGTETTPSNLATTGSGSTLSSIANPAQEHERPPFASHSGPELATASMPANDDRKYIEGIQIPIVMGSIVTATFLVLLDTTIIATAVPKITSEFHSLQDISWYGSAFQLSSAAIQPLVGKLYTQFSLKWVFLGFFFFFELGSLLCGIATSSTMLIVGRAVGGIGAAGVFAGSMTIIGTALRPEKRAFLTSLVIGCSQLGVVIGPLIGGAFTQKVSWRWCFYINLPLGAVVLAGTLFVTITDQIPLLPFRQVLPVLHKKLDLVGFCLLSPAAVMLLLALQWGGAKYAWDSATIIGLFCGSGVTFLVFVAWNWHKGQDGLIPTVVARNRIVIASCCVATTVMGSTFLCSYWMPVYFQTVKGKNPLVSGVDMLPNILPSLVFGVLTGFLIGKVGFYLPFAVVGAAISTVGAGLLSTLHPNSSTSHWVGYLFLLSVGRGLAQQTSFIAIPQATVPDLVPVAMSTMIFSQYMGGSVFLSLSNVIFSTSLRSQLAKEAPGVDPEMVVKAGASAVRDIGIPEELLPGVLQAYCTSVNRVFYLAVASGGLLFVSSFFSGWIDTRKRGDAEGTADTTSADEKLL